MVYSNISNYTSCLIIILELTSGWPRITPFVTFDNTNTQHSGLGFLWPNLVAIPDNNAMLGHCWQWSSRPRSASQGWANVGSTSDFEFFNPLLHTWRMRMIITHNLPAVVRCANMWVWSWDLSFIPIKLLVFWLFYSFFWTAVCKFSILIDAIGYNGRVTSFIWYYIYCFLLSLITCFIVCQPCQK